MVGNIKRCVVDASVILAKLLPDEKVGLVEDVFAGFEKNKVDLIAPELLKYEVANALRSAVIQKRVKMATAVELLKAFLTLPIIYLEVDLTEVLKIGLAKSLSVYDAAYVGLAKQEKISLRSLDKRLAGQ